MLIAVIQMINRSASADRRRPCICEANSIVDKVQYIVEARNTVVAIRIYVRLLIDLRHISLSLGARLSERVETISKQLAAWQKYYSKDHNT